MSDRFKCKPISLICFLLLLGLSACSDEISTVNSNDSECDVSIPKDFTPVDADLSYFQSQSVPADDQHSTFFDVRQVATIGGALLSSSSQYAIVLTFVSSASVTPDVSDGACTWDYSEISGFQGLDITVSSTSSANGTNWEIYADGNSGDGVELDNFKLISGFTSEEAQEGEWNMYNPENSGELFWTYTWDIESEDNYQFNFEMGESEGGEVINYTRTGAENSMTYSTNSDVFDIYWNTESDNGWIETNNNERRCYSSFENSDC